MEFPHTCDEIARLIIREAEKKTGIKKYGYPDVVRDVVIKGGTTAK